MKKLMIMAILTLFATVMFAQTPVKVPVKPKVTPKTPQKVTKIVGATLATNKDDILRPNLQVNKARQQTTVQTNKKKKLIAKLKKSNKLLY